MSKAKEQNLITIGTMARFVPKKNLLMFLDALALLKEQDISFKALIGGQGEQQAELQAKTHQLKLENNVEFLGWVADTQEFYQNIDIYCLPSADEPFGIVILEAFKAGVPVVSTKTLGPVDIIEHGKTGLLCDINAAALAEELAELSKQPKLAAKLIKNAQQLLVTKYSLDQAAEQLENIILKNLYG